MSKKTNRYADFSKETQSFMAAVEKHLIDKVGGIEPQWEGILNMLATQFDLFFECKKRIKEDGILVPDSKQIWKTHPLVKVQNDAQIQIVKLVTEFGLSPRSLKNIPLENNDDNNFLAGLVNAG